MKLIRTMILTLIIAGLIEQARSICIRKYSSTTPSSYVINLTAGTSTSSTGTETSSSTVITSATTTITKATIPSITTANMTVPSISLDSSTVLSSTELTYLNAMLPSYTKSFLLYNATRDGFTAKEFHNRCDNAANTVTIIRNNLDYVFGGFTAAQWSSTGPGSWKADTTAFIFSLRRNGTSNNYILPIKSTHVIYAIRGDPSYGPIFGTGYDIAIVDQSNNNTGSWSNIQSYTRPTYPSGSIYQQLLDGGWGNWLTTEIEVYQLFK